MSELAPSVVQGQQVGDGGTLSRRHFLARVTTGTGLAVALAVVDPLSRPAAADDQIAEVFDFTDVMLLSSAPFVHDFLIAITPDNRIRFEVPRAEIGQGITTATAMIVAEELDVDLDWIDVELSPAEPRRVTGQFTGGSTSISVLWNPLRRVAALLRQNLLYLGGAVLSADPATLGTADGRVVAPDGRSVPFSDLSVGVEGPSPWAPFATPKDPSTYRVIGQPRGRVDALDIVTGGLRTAGDLDVVPDTVVAVVARPPSFGADVIDFDPAVANLPGVVDVFRIPIGVEGDTDGVAVLARTFGEAQRGLDALGVRWGPGPNETLDDAAVIAELQALNAPTLPPRPWFGTEITGEFIFPYLSHAPLETMSAVADATGPQVRVWTGAQTPLAAQAKIAREFGVPIEQVDLTVVPSGGSFGRRLFFDAAVEAARISRRAQRPVKLLYTRSQDTSQGRARPLSVHNVQAVHAPGWWGNGRLLQFHHRAATAAVDFRHGLGDGLTAGAGEALPAAFSSTYFATSQAIHYEADQATISLQEAEFPVPTASWRGVYAGTVNVANEIIVDEVARSVGEDELAYRLRTLEDDRAKAVLRKAAQVGQWGRSMGPGQAQGLGLHVEYKSRAAVLAEVAYLPGTDQPVRVTKLVIVLDVNRVVNPTGLEAQAIGAATDAITSVVTAGLHVDGGAIQESSYADFRVARMADVPAEVQVVLMPDNGDDPGGAGELVVAPAGAAIANAFARASGIQPRRFPLNEHYRRA
jgi:isoquinoline 1-oxidoreductase beta subunit